MLPARVAFTACINLFTITANKVVIVCKLACLVLLVSGRGGRRRGKESRRRGGDEDGENGRGEEEREAEEGRGGKGVGRQGKGGLRRRKGRGEEGRERPRSLLQDEGVSVVVCA